jgi:hypothetical protein
VALAVFNMTVDLFTGLNLGRKKRVGKLLCAGIKTQVWKKYFQLLSTLDHGFMNTEVQATLFVGTLFGLAISTTNVFIALFLEATHSLLQLRVRLIVRCDSLPARLTYLVTD